MPIDLTGIQNVDASDSPDQRLATEFFKTKLLARFELRIRSRFGPSHKIQVALLEALSNDNVFGLRFIFGRSYLASWQ